MKSLPILFQHIKISIHPLYLMLLIASTSLFLIKRLSNILEYCSIKKYALSDDFIKTIMSTNFIRKVEFSLYTFSYCFIDQNKSIFGFE